MIDIKKRLRARFSSVLLRRMFIKSALLNLPQGYTILDAGCGSQQYRPFCDHLKYKAQDFGQFTTDVTAGFASRLGVVDRYNYGELDYIGDIWDISECDGYFDAILCAEVFEHIPYPTETIKEFARLLKPGGTLILTLPSNCLRHMDPYYFYSGFSNRYLEKFLGENDFLIEVLDPVGDYYSWLAAELARTASTHSWLARLCLAPALLWYMTRKKTEVSVNSLCIGYHVIAKKRMDSNI